MVEGKHDFRLLVDEVDFLDGLAVHDESLAALLTSHQAARGRSVTLSLTRAEVEEVRDFLTTRLAAVGFDEDYSPNEEGRKLEKLIDKFYVRD